MSAEIKSNVPDNGGENEKEMKEEAPPPADNGQTKEDVPVAEKVEEKVEEKKAEPAPPKPTVHKANFEKDVVYLYQLSRTPLLPSTSPYCLKIETWLRLAGVKYEVSPLIEHSFSGNYYTALPLNRTMSLGTYLPTFNLTHS